MEVVVISKETSKDNYDPKDDIYYPETISQDGFVEVFGFNLSQYSDLFCISDGFLKFGVAAKFDVAACKRLCKVMNRECQRLGSIPQPVAS